MMFAAVVAVVAVTAAAVVVNCCCRRHRCSNHVGKRMIDNDVVRFSLSISSSS